ncbi:MAG TPA: LacI family DNA-binding transcriptional regulator [Anaerolineaceae bacterium]|nr:LacI family DNA-binding transcriptional regulator [Anaerolineaceae bacterium]
MARVSIKDIARSAGVSFSTVSRALNDNPLISQEVRARIQVLARELGYTPNALAQSLQSRQTNTIGLILTTISDPFFVDVVKGVEEAASQADISVFLASSYNNPEREIEIIENFSRRRVDGVIVAASRISSEYASRLEQIHIPVVMVNNQAEGGTYHQLYSVSVDDYAGGRAAVDHLISLGHRCIGYIGAANRPSSNSRRMKSYLDVMTEHGITVPSNWTCDEVSNEIGDLEGDIHLGQCLAPRLVAAGVTAMFCYCDTVAAGAILACHDLGVAVPGRVSVIGYDDNALCEIVQPRITTVHQPKRELGLEAMRMLLTSMRGEQVLDFTFEPSLVIRESTAPPDPSLKEVSCPLSV